MWVLILGTWSDGMPKKMQYWICFYWFSSYYHLIPLKRETIWYCDKFCKVPIGVLSQKQSERYIPFSRSTIEVRVFGLHFPISKMYVEHQMLNCTRRNTLQSIWKTEVTPSIPQRFCINGSQCRQNSRSFSNNKKTLSMKSSFKNTLIILTMTVFPKASFLHISRFEMKDIPLLFTFA